jgi:hypothetical protein
MGGVNGVTGLHKDDGIVTAVLEAAVVAACGKEVAGRGKTRHVVALRLRRTKKYRSEIRESWLRKTDCGSHM